MKKSAVIGSVISIIFLATPAHAESTSPENGSSAMEQVAEQGEGGQVGLAAPEPRDAKGRQIHEPREGRERHERGLEGESVIIVIGALIIAVGLAYGIGRRNGHKHGANSAIDSE